MFLGDLCVQGVSKFIGVADSCGKQLSGRRTLTIGQGGICARFRVEQNAVLGTELRPVGYVCRGSVAPVRGPISGFGHPFGPCASRYRRNVDPLGSWAVHGRDFVRVQVSDMVDRYRILGC